MKKTLKLLFFLLLGLGFIWWFMGKLGPDEVVELRLSFQNANYYWFSLAILINILSHLVRAIRWRQLITPLGHRPKLGPSFLSVMSGYLANLAVPRLGEVVRCGLLSNNQKIPFEKLIGTVIAERAVDTLLFLIILVSSLAFNLSIFNDYIRDSLSFSLSFGKGNIYIYIAIAILATSIASLVLLRKKIRETKIYKKSKGILGGLYDGIRAIFKLKHPILFILNSLLIWFLWILGSYIIFQSLKDTSHLGFNIAIIITVLGAIGPVITPGGIGVFPAIIAESLSVYKIGKPIGYASGWLMWITSQIGALVLGLIGFIALPYKKKKNNIPIENGIREDK